MLSPTTEGRRRTPRSQRSSTQRCLRVSWGSR